MNQDLKQIFDQLYDMYKSVIYRYICYLTHDRVESEDLFQETWLRVVKHLDQIQDVKEKRAWIYAIATNLYRDHLRKKRIRLSFMNRAESDPSNTRFLGSDSVASPETKIEQREMAAAALKVLDKLPLKMRQVFILREIEGFSYEEIAGLLKLPLGTAKSRMHRAIRRIRQELAETHRISGIHLGDFA
ncbi:MAG: RNA polymerase sigma factor [Candidatus Aminicenantes bacterium]|nr:RNA polymerase sigma factor [Candidatus Aminicenantes bacterium]